MELDYAFICDYADATGPKINALGIGFNTIFTANTPATHSLFFLVFQIRTNVLEAGIKKIQIDLINDDGKPIIPTINQQAEVPKPPSGNESTGRIAISFNNINFPEYGTYSLKALVEGKEMISIPIRVAPIPQSKPAG